MEKLNPVKFRAKMAGACKSAVSYVTDQEISISRNVLKFREDVTSEQARR